MPVIAMEAVPEGAATHRDTAFAIHPGDPCIGQSSQDVEAATHDKARSRRRLGDGAGHRATLREAPDREVLDAFLIADREDLLVYSTWWVVGRRMPAVAFHRELELSEALRGGINRYLYALMAQFAQTAACTRYHLLESRLARWLLMTADRAHSERFPLTHDFLADMLGVRRVGVTKAAGELRRKGLISYRRGQIAILDRQGLKSASCGCYQAMKRTYDRFLR